MRKAAVLAAVIGVVVWGAGRAGAEATPMKELRVVVVDEAGRPIQRAEVRWYGDKANDTMVKTGADGAAIVRYGVGSTSLRVAVEVRGCVSVLTNWYGERPAGGQTKAMAEGVVPAEVKVVMVKGKTISGIVVDEKGEPVEGAEVDLSLSRRRASKKLVGGEFAPYVSENVKIVSGKSGRWVFEEAPEDIEGITMGVSSPLCAERAFYEIEPVKDVKPLWEGTVKSVLKRGTAMVRGRVVDENGKPVVGAEVGYGEDRVADNVMSAVLTDVEGQFVYGVQPETTAVLTVKKKGLAPSIEVVAAKAGENPVEIKLVGAKAIRGKVVGPDGEPVVRGYVWVEKYRGYRTVSTTIRTDEKGEFSWEDAPAEGVQADVQGRGDAGEAMKGGKSGRRYARSKGVTLVPGEENVVRLGKALRVTGTVVDAETGKPVEGFKVTSGIDWGSGSSVSWQRGENGVLDGVTMNPGGVFEKLFDYPYPGYLLMVEAEGYAPAVSKRLTLADEDQALEFRMVKSEGVKGMVVGTDGKPVAGAKVIVVMPGGGVQLNNGVMPEWGGRDAVTAKTGENGEFSLSAQTGSVGLLVVMPEGIGYRELAAGEVGSGKEIRVEKWATVEGVAKIGEKVAAGEKVGAFAQETWEATKPRFHTSNSVEVGADGRYVLGKLRPGKYWVGREVHPQPNSTTLSHGKMIEVKGGEVVKLDIGGTGRPVVGKIEIPAELREMPRVGFDMCRLETAVEYPARPELPKEVEGDPEKAKAWYAEWQKSEAGKAFTAAVEKAQADRRSYPVIVKSDGTWRVDDVPAGKYTLQVQMYQRAEGDTCGIGEALASGGGTVEVTEGKINEVQDVGSVVKLVAKRIVKEGDVAPAFVVKDLAGGEVSLEKYKGKYVLVDFWATWCGPCVEETPALKKVYEKFGKRSNFVMLGLSLDPKEDAPKKYAEKNELKWVQGFLGDWAKATVPNEWGVQGIPSIWLVGPDGKVVAKGLRGEGIEAAVEKALGAREGM